MRAALFLLLACAALCFGQTVLILDNDNSASDTTDGIQVCPSPRHR